MYKHTYISQLQLYSGYAYAYDMYMKTEYSLPQVVGGRGIELRRLRRVEASNVLRSIHVYICFNLLFIRVLFALLITP